MSYPHRFRVSERAAGTQNPDTGQHTPGAETVLYDGPADVQDGGKALRRDNDGRAVETSDAVVFLADPSAAAQLRPGLAGVVTWEDGKTSDAEILRSVRLDGTLFLRWL